MVNPAQVIKGLRAERSRAQKQVDRLEKAIGALQKLAGRRADHKPDQISVANGGGLKSMAR